jgi:hypothetical protein
MASSVLPLQATHGKHQTTEQSQTARQEVPMSVRLAIWLLRLNGASVSYQPKRKRVFITVKDKS